MLILERITVFLLGSALYGSIELLSRGWTHWSMLLAGGICTSIMYCITNQILMPIWQKWLICAASITTVEFLCGIIFNLHLDWHIWDYSAKPFNLMGQICAAYSIMWLGLSVPGVWLCKKLHSILH